MAELTDVPGFRLGHWTDQEARTGCTVLLFDQQTLGACDVRGAAPGSRELDLLRPGRLAPHPDAILVTGGSAFGLAAADGVVRWLKERGRGFSTSAGPVPLVPAAVIYDLSVGQAVAPDAGSGYAATDAAVELSKAETGRVGAGIGATFGGIRGPERRPGGLGIAQVAIPEGTVTAIAVLNAFGDAIHPNETDPRYDYLNRNAAPVPGQSTTLLAAVTDIPLDHGAVLAMTVAMHDGLARCIRPAHTVFDGDIAFAVTLQPGGPTDATLVIRASLAAELAVERTIQNVLTGITPLS